MPDEADSIAETIARGVAKPRPELPMPAFGKTFDADQIADLVAYLKQANQR